MLTRVIKGSGRYSIPLIQQATRDSTHVLRAPFYEFRARDTLLDVVPAIVLAPHPRSEAAAFLALTTSKFRAECSHCARACNRCQKFVEVW